MIRHSNPIRRPFLVVTTFALLAVCGLAWAQQGPWGRRFRPSPLDGIPADRAGVPNWGIDPQFSKDVFTFVRVQYDSYRRGGRGGFGWYGRGGAGWETDWPDSDLNFSYRLQQLTSLKVNPEPISLRLTDPKLFDYPFLYMIEPGSICLSEEEVTALRRYLLNGGFMMVDDFWGDDEYDTFYQQIKRVFPDREPEELPLEHEVFQCVYRLKERPQVPSIHTFEETYDPSITWEDHHRGNVRDVHYRGISDDKGRLMAIICHNTDLGDGWEREGEDERYFEAFSMKKAYPMGINIVTYAMTH